MLRLAPIVDDHQGVTTKWLFLWVSLLAISVLYTLNRGRKLGSKASAVALLPPNPPRLEGSYDRPGFVTVRS